MFDCILWAIRIFILLYGISRIYNRKFLQYTNDEAELVFNGICDISFIAYVIYLILPI